jgi:hypothetical protein
MTIIDQTWVVGWAQGVPPMQEVLNTRAWIRSLPADLQEVVTRFPPRCLVKSKTFAIEIPYMFSVGFIDEYHRDGTVTVCQSPGGPSAIVKLEDLSFVAPWKGLTSTQVRSFLGRAQPSP